MRKYLFNGAVIGSLIGGIGVVRSTISGPRDWRLILSWISWAATLAIAIGTVVDHESDFDLELED